MKKYVIFAGVNGAGKSTLYYSVPHENIPRINTDEIVRKMGNWQDSHLQMKAASMAVRKINEYFQKEISFYQETTLCGHYIMKNIKKAKLLGYFIEMHYVGIDSSQTAKERVALRVKKGGHGIDGNVIERRYTASLENLNEAIPLCDKTVIYDNTIEFVKIAEFEKDCIVWLEKSVKADWFRLNVLDKMN